MCQPVFVCLNTHAYISESASFWNDWYDARCFNTDSFILEWFLEHARFDVTPVSSKTSRVKLVTSKSYLKHLRSIASQYGFQPNIRLCRTNSISENIKIVVLISKIKNFQFKISTYWMYSFLFSFVTLISPPPGFSSVTFICPNNSSSTVK